MFYLEYYDIEKYLFSKVHERFHQDGYLCAFDFFSTVGWKSNRPKGMIREALSKRCPDLDQAVKSLTGDIHEAVDHENRLKILLDVRGIGLPMATAIPYRPLSRPLHGLRHACLQPVGSLLKPWEPLDRNDLEGYEEFRQAVREKRFGEGLQKASASGHGPMAMDAGCGRSAEEGGLYPTHRDLNSSSGVRRRYRAVRASACLLSVSVRGHGRAREIREF